MLEVLTDTEAREVKRRRPSISQNSFLPPLLKTLVFNTTRLNFESSIEDGCVKSYLRRKVASFREQGTVLKIEDQDLKACLLNEANLQFNKSLYNLSIYKQLVSRGLWTWAYVTLYYAQFYAINGLLNLQGNAFSRPLLLDTSSNETKQALFHVYPKDFIDGTFYLERRSYKPHEDLWKQYHKVYGNYSYNLSDYNLLYDFDRRNEFKFMNLRHELNYDIPFLIQGFLEYLSSEEELEIFADKMSQNALSYNFSEDENLELEYIGMLRIKLLFDLLHEILDSSHLQLYRTNFYEKRMRLLSNIKDNTCVSQNFLAWIGAETTISPA